MILNNKKRTINFQLRRFLILFITAAFIFLIFNVNYFEYNEGVIGKGYLTIFIVGLYLLYYLTGILRNYHFFYYTDNGSKLVFRYYSLRPFNKKQNSVEIDKQTFIDFKIVKLLFGFSVQLNLFQNLGKGKVAKYPPINITLLKNKEIDVLQKSLNSYKLQK